MTRQAYKEAYRLLRSDGNDYQNTVVKHPRYSPDCFATADYLISEGYDKDIVKKALKSLVSRYDSTTRRWHMLHYLLSVGRAVSQQKRYPSSIIPF